MMIRLTILLILLPLAGCVSRNAPLEPISSDTRVQIRMESASGPEQPINDDEFVMSAAATGAAGGALVGTLASATCGPFYMFCAPFTGGIGAVAGFFAGGIFGAATAINADEREVFSSNMASVFASSDPGQQLQLAFTDLAARRWELVDANPDRVISLQFDDFRVIQHSPNRFSLGYSASLTVMQPADEKEKSAPRYSYNHVTPSRELDFFLDETGENFRAEFSRGIASLVSHMANSL